MAFKVIYDKKTICFASSSSIVVSGVEYAGNID
jgi:hypothetical protein